MDALHADAERNGAIFTFGCQVMGVDLKSSRKKILAFDKNNNEKITIHSDCVINAAGIVLYYAYK